MDAFTNIALIAGNGAGALGLYGSYLTGSLYPALAGSGFCFLFNFTRERVRGAQSQPPYQSLLLLSMLICSFTLHMVYLPAGLCCFVALLLCQNELLTAPNKPGGAPNAGARKAHEAAKEPTKKE